MEAATHLGESTSDGYLITEEGTDGNMKPKSAASHADFNFRDTTTGAQNLVEYCICLKRNSSPSTIA